MAGGLNSYSGADTLLLNGTLLQGLPDGKVFELTFDDAIAETKVGKDGNTITVYKAR